MDNMTINNFCISVYEKYGFRVLTASQIAGIHGILSGRVYNARLETDLVESEDYFYFPDAKQNKPCSFYTLTGYVKIMNAIWNRYPELKPSGLCIAHQVEDLYFCRKSPQSYSDESNSCTEKKSNITVYIREEILSLLEKMDDSSLEDCFKLMDKAELLMSTYFNLCKLKLKK